MGFEKGAVASFWTGGTDEKGNFGAGQQGAMVVAVGRAVLVLVEGGERVCLLYDLNARARRMCQ